MVKGIVLRLISSAIAVWVSTVLPGINITASSTWGTIGTIILVALIFGIVNAVIKPIAKVLGCALYLVTLGLIALVVNGLLYLLVSWISGELGIPFHVDNFWPSAVLGALLVSIVSAVLGNVVKDNGES
jgi:putative membrane protein